MELVYLFKILVRRKFYLLFFGILGAAIAFVLTINKPKLYKSISQISTGFTLTESMRLSEDAFNTTQIDVKFNNVIENITSAKVLNLLSYRLILHDLNSQRPFTTPEKSVDEKNPALLSIDKKYLVKSFTGKYDSMLILRPNVPEEKQLIDVLKMYGYHMDAIKKNLEVTRYQRTDYINITYFSENPELSAYTVDMLVKEFLRYYTNFMRERSLEARNALDSISRKRKTELDAAILTKVNFITDSLGGQINNDQSALNASKLTQVGIYESSLAEELSRVQSLNYQIQQINLQLAGTPDDGSTTTQAPGTNSEYLELRRQYDQAYDEYVRSGSSNAELRTKMDDIQRKMRLAASSSGANNSSINNSFNASQRSSLVQQRINLEGQLRSANSKIEFYKSKLAETGQIITTAAPRSSERLEQLDKEIEIATLEYTNAKEKVSLASSFSDVNTSNFLQTIYGQPALYPEPSRRMVIMALSGASGILLSALAFLLFAYVDQSVRTPFNLERLTGLKMLGTIESVNLKASSISDQITQFAEDNKKRKNNFRETLRKIRYELEASGKRIILLTSTELQQGKTTLIQALAFSMSLSKQRVLIIDTNFCNNDLTTQNQAKETLEQIEMENEVFKAEAIEDFITKTPVEGVDIIGCSGGDYTPTEVLPRNHLLRYLPKLLTKYNFIFLEGAPLNHFTDTKELIQFAEGVVMVIASSAKIEPADRVSIQYLKQQDNKFLGVILNKVNATDLKA